MVTSIPTNADAFASNLTSVLEAYSSAAGQLLDPTPGRVVLLAPGQEAAWDDCCDGQVWVRLVNVEPTPTFDPSRRGGLGVCATPFFVVTAEIGVTRCAAVFDDNRGTAPTPAAITADGEQSVADMSTLLGVLACDDNTRSIVSWTPTGPMGGCHGGYWTFTLAVDNCIQCQEVS